MTDLQPPPSVLAWLGGILSTVLLLLFGSLAWSFNRSQRELDALAKAVREEIPKVYAKSVDVQAAQVRLAELASRSELAERLEQLEKRQDARMQEHRDFQRVMNATTADNLKDLREGSERRDKNAQEFRTEMRNNFHDLSIKLEAVSTTQRIQGASQQHS